MSKKNKKDKNNEEPLKCTKCKEPLLLIKIRSSYQFSSDPHYYCNNCNLYYISTHSLPHNYPITTERIRFYRNIWPEAWFEEEKQKDLPRKRKKAKSNKKKEQIAELPPRDTYQVALNPNIFVTRTSMKKCLTEGHQIEDINALVRIILPNGTVNVERIPALYCKECDQYYILDWVFESLKSKGILVCRVVEKSYWTKYNYNSYGMELEPETLLHMLGYNVSKKDGLTAGQRQRLLSILVDEGILSKYYIIEHLNYLITFNGQKDNMENAVYKWEEDRAFLTYYTESWKPSIWVSEIQHTTYHEPFSLSLEGLKND